MPDDFDVVQFRGVLGQPFDGQPMGAGRERRLADMDRAIVEHDDDGLDTGPGFRTVEAVEGFEMRF